MKRIFDVVASSVALVVLILPLLVLCFLILVKLGKPIFFSQVRPGYLGRPFKMWKFRTMTNVHGADGLLLPDAQRLSAFGSFLRASSLDELPGLWNVLLGEMSLVGPRPLLMQYLPLYSPEQFRRHEVRPGVTGWAQVNGRNAIGWDDKFKLDVWYVENRNMFLDLKIIWLTVGKVLLRHGINEAGEVTMSAFTGSNDSKNNS